jgi:hypothetical protein
MLPLTVTLPVLARLMELHSPSVPPNGDGPQAGDVEARGRTRASVEGAIDYYAVCLDRDHSGPCGVDRFSLADNKGADVGERPRENIAVRRGEILSMPVASQDKGGVGRPGG